MLIQSAQKDGASAGSQSEIEARPHDVPAEPDVNGCALAQAEPDSVPTTRNAQIETATVTATVRSAVGLCPTEGTALRLVRILVDLLPGHFNPLVEVQSDLSGLHLNAPTDRLTDPTASTWPDAYVHGRPVGGYPSGCVPGVSTVWKRSGVRHP